MQEFSIIGSNNYPPTLITVPDSTLTVVLGKRIEVSTLGTDLDGNIITTSWTPISFAVYDSTANLLTFSPVLFSDIGSYPIVLTLSDLYGKTDYRFTLFVVNNPPIFLETVPSP